MASNKLSGAARRKRPKLRRWMLHKFGDGTSAPCAGCGIALSDATMTIDRFPVPGRDGGGYTRKNVRPMCHGCNSGHVGEPPLPQVEPLVHLRWILDGSGHFPRFGKCP